MTQTQAINFTPPNTPVTYGAAPLTLTATGGASGNAVIFSIVSGPGSISGSTLTITGVGTIVVAANQAGNANYTPAVQVTQSVLVIQAPQTINFSAPPSPVTYGVSPITLSASGGASGNAVAFSLVSGPGAVSNNKLTITGVGTVVVAANQTGTSNYAAATQVTQSVVVNQASQAITFSAPSSPVIYGVGPIALSASATSGLGVTFNMVSGPGSISGSTLTVTGVGTIVVAANQAGNANYLAAAQVTQSVVINQASQTITFPAPSSPVTYGVGPIALSASATSGLGVAFNVVSGPGSISSSTLTITGAGTVEVAANQAGNANYTAATQITQSVVVNPATPAFGVTTSSTPSTYGGSVTFTSTISSGPTGTVTFYDSGTAIGTGAINGTTATFSTSALAVGTHTITAGWPGSTNYNAVTSSAITQTVNPATPALSVATSSTPSAYGGPVTFTATISSGPTGTVTFYDSGAAIGTGAISGTTATFSTSTLAAGTHTITANWAGNTNYNAVTSGAITQTVNTTTPIITWSTPAPITYGTALNSTQLNASSNVMGTFAYNPGSGTIPGAGSQTLSATFTPNNTTDYNTTTATVPLTVNPATPVLSVATSGTPSTYGGSVNFTATISSGPTGSVTFYDGGSVIGTVNISGTTATFTSGTLAVGTHTITAGWAGNTNYNSVTSNAITQTVNQVTPTLNVVTSGTPSTYGGSVTFTATISSGPTGSVTFYDGGSVIGTVNISGTTAIFTTSTLAAGAHTITAGWAGNTNYNSVTSNAITQTVNQVTPTLSVVTSVTPSAYGDSVTFIATVSSGPTGSVTFFDGGAATGTGLISGTTAIFTTSTLAAGAHTITAGWAGNTNYNAVTSSAITQTVSQATPTLSVATSNAPSTYGGSVIFTATISSGPAGSVTFYDSGTSIGTAMIVGTTATLTTSTLAAGVHTITCGWAGNTNYNAVTSSAITQTVNQATPVITWATPTNITPGLPLSETQLNATANVPGTFIYSPAAGAVLPVGSQTLSVTFMPTDTIDYSTATATVTLGVSRALTAGVIYAVAGNGTPGYFGDSGPATSAELDDPYGVAVDAAGNIYIADTRNDSIRMVTASTGIITTVAGIGDAVPSSAGCSQQTDLAGDGCPATSAFFVPSGVAVDASGNIYITDGFNGLIRKVTATNGVISSTSIITTVAGSCTSYSSPYCNLYGGYGGDGGPATSATLFSPLGVAVDASGNIYIADTNNGRIRKVTASTGLITTVAGTWNYDEGIYAGGYSGDGGPATSAVLNYPSGVAVDASGNIYIADTGNNVIREVTIANGNITTIAGNFQGFGGYSGDGGPAINAELYQPSGVAVDANSNVYIVDAGNKVIREVSSLTGIITTVAGGGTGCPQQTDGVGDGCPATSAEVYPSGVVVDAYNNIYFADPYNSLVRAVGFTTTIPTINWLQPEPITYGTALSATQLNASAGGVPGTYTYNYPAGTVLNAGTYNLTVTFTPAQADMVYYTTATATVTLTVNPATPVITWAAPPAITYGSALTAAQFNVAASGVNGVGLSGNFGYAPTLGTVLSAGPHTLTVTFAPANSSYTSTIAQATVIVNPASGYPPDTGTVQLTVNRSQIASVGYNTASTPSSITEALAVAASSSMVYVSAADNSLYIEATPAAIAAYGGLATDFSYSVTVSDTAGNPSASFAASPSSGSLDGGANAQTTSTMIPIYSFAGSYDPAGNLLGYTDSVMGAFNFTTGSGASGYDSLNRLSAGTLTPPAGSNQTPQSFCWSYDAFGNRTAQATSNLPFTNAVGSACQFAGSATLLTNTLANYNASNQFTATSAAPGGVTYDLSGDVTYDGQNQYLYNADGQICAVFSNPLPNISTMTGYLYDADGTRVAKGTISAWSCDPAVSGFTTTNDYILGLGGEQVTEMGMGGTTSSGETNGLVWQHTNAWAAGKLIATYDGDGLHFYLDDPLGTRRVQTDYAGVVERNCQSLPYGDGETCATIPTEHLFTGKERDTESGNDYFGARYYASTMGRFMSPDWSAQAEPVPYAKLGDPQSLNLYSYVRNNPLSNVDLDGHDCSGKDASPCVRMTQISQTVNFYNSKGDVASSVNVTTNLTVTSDAQTGAVTSVSASATATNVSGAKFSASQLSTIGSTVGGIQQAGASMALGSNPQQLMTAIVAKESTLGLAAPTNPLQLSGSSGFKPHAGDTGYNIQGALNVLQERGRRSNYDPATTYDRYNGVSDPVQRATNVRNFMNIYNGMTQSSWGYALPPLPTAPIPAGLQ